MDSVKQGCERPWPGFSRCYNTVAADTITALPVEGPRLMGYYLCPV